MATQVQFRRGTTGQTSTFTGAVGEVTVDLTKNTCVVHNGSTQGGFPLLREDGINMALSIGNLSNCAVKFANDPDTGIISPGANQIALVTGAVNRLAIDASGAVTFTGNVSVGGTTTFTGASTFSNSVQLNNTLTVGGLSTFNNNAIINGNLTVTGSTNFTSPSLFPAGTPSAAGIGFIGDPDTGFYSPGLNQVGITTAGVSRLVVDATGNLNVAAGGTLIFEGATDDGFETTLTVTDPTADRTLTFPDVTGTLVTTGDTGTVTSTMIANGTIVDGDISASAGIVDTKLATISTADKVSLSALNIDGGTDIGAALADADLFIVDDGGTGTNRKAAASRITDYAFGKVTGDITIASNGTSAISSGVIVDADINASAGIVDTKLATISTAGKVSNSATTATSSNVTNAIVARDASGNFSAGTITATTFSGSGSSLTSLPAGQLTGTIPSGVLGNSNLFVGTTSIALNRSSANQGLTGISSIALPGAVSGTVTVTPAATAGTTSITLPATSGTLITTGDTGTVTSTMIANGTIVDADISATAEIAVSKLADGSARQLLQTDAAGTGVEWASNIDVPGTLDVTGVATFDASVVIAGDLTVNGTTTNINSQTLVVEDKNIVIADVAVPTDATADGGGVTLKGTTDKLIQWLNSSAAWTFSEHVDLANTKEYRINGIKVLDSTTLGSAVVNSSLTSVGTLSSGTWNATTIAVDKGGTGQTTYTDGQLLIGNSTGNTLTKTTLTAGTNISITNGAGSITIGTTAIGPGGGTITGNLEIGSTGSLSFEGTTVDGFETTLGVIDPTADRTINLPNVSGTVITTGDTGTVTSTMIADGTIVDIDINASAAIAHSKLANITAGSVLLGNATNIPTATALSGDVTVNSSGVTAISAGVIVNADVSASAAIAHSKLANITAGSVLLGNASNVPTATALTGDVTVNSSGVTAISSGVIVDADINASAAIADTKLATISTAGKVANSATTATSGFSSDTIVLRDAFGAFSALTITAGQFNGSGAGLTGLPAGELTGTIPSGVLGNSTLYVGTTAIALNRASANLDLTGITSLQLPGATSGKVTLTPAAVAGTATAITIPATSGTLITTGDSGTITSTMIADGTIVNADIATGAAIAHSKLANITAGSVLLGNATNVPTATALSGDVTVNSSGVTAISAGVIVDNDINASAAISDSKLATISSAGKVANSATTATSANTGSAIVARDASGNFSAGTITATFSGSGASLTSLPAGQLTGTIPSGVLGNSTLYVGTTAIALNRASADLSLTGIIGVALSGATSGTSTLKAPPVAGTGQFFLPTTSGNLIGTGDTGTVTSTMILDGTIVNADINASAGIVDTKLATISTAGKVANSATTATSANTLSAIVARDASGNFSAGTITATTFSGSGASLTSLPAGQLTGTIPSGVLGNSSLFVGTTSIALNRASANLGLTGITSLAMPGATSGTITLTPAATAGTTAITIPATAGTLVTTGDSGTVTSTMIADGTIVNGDINASAAIADTKLATISTAGKVANSATTATSANTPNAIVARDGSGDFTAGTITASLLGNASTATGAAGSTFFTQATASEGQIGAKYSGQNTVYLYNNASFWGIYSASGGSAFQYTRSTGQFNFNGSSNSTAGCTFSNDATNRADITTRVDSGFYEHDTVTTAEGWPINATYMHMLACTHSNDTNYYSMQIAASFYNNTDLYYRSTNGSGTTAWTKIWNAANDGSGSGLDADLLDGLDSTSFLRSNTGTTWNGSAGGVFTVQLPNSASGANTGQVNTLQLYQPVVNTDAFLTFHIAGDYAAHFGIDGTTNDLFYGGWSAGAVKHKVWHAGNDGVGSGLDADLLDGLSATDANTPSTIVARDASGNFSAGQITLNTLLSFYSGASTTVYAANSDPVGYNFYAGGTSDSYFASNNFIIAPGFSEVARFTSGGLLIGTSTTVGSSGQLHVASVNSGTLATFATWNGASDKAGSIDILKSRGSSAGTLTLVAAGDDLGALRFIGTDGSSPIAGATVSAVVDATPALNDMPTRLVFSTVPDGTTTLTERLRITNGGVIAYNQPNITSKGAAATLTIAELQTGIIQYTGAAATLTLPTGTLAEGGFNEIYTNLTFQWSVINTGSGTCTIGANTAHTIVGSAAVAAGTSARFASRRTAANTFVSYRI